MPNTPLYPFGYGLSYTQFQISDLRLDGSTIPVTGSIKASVQVQNVGKRAGDEVVQLYIQDLASSVTRPVRELKGFQRITLAPGEKRQVDFTLTSKELGALDRNLKFAVEPGEFRVYAGDSSDAQRCRQRSRLLLLCRFARFARDEDSFTRRTQS